MRRAAESLPVARTQVDDPAAGGVHELPDRLHVSEAHEVTELVEEDRALFPGRSKPGRLGSSALRATQPLT